MYIATTGHLYLQPLVIHLFLDTFRHRSVDGFTIFALLVLLLVFLLDTTVSHWCNHSRGRWCQVLALACFAVF